jgi:hypothetical protein
MIVFAFYFGMLMEVGNDLANHYNNMQLYYAGKSISEILRNPLIYGMGHDYFHVAVKIFVSRFSNSPAVFGGVLACIYGAIFLLFFREFSKFYKNFPECTKAFTKLVSIAPQIGEFVVSLTKADGIAEILPIIIKAYDELYPKIKELIQESSGLPAEVKENFKKILATLKTLNYYINAFKHAFANIGDIVYNINAAKLAYKEQRYAQLGRYVGGAVSLLLNIQ